MPLSQSKLASELEAMEPVATEIEAIYNFATAFDTYFQDASVIGLPVTGTTAPAKVAMIAAMPGLSITGALSMTAGVVAYWGVIATTVAVVWPLVPPLTSGTPPPLLSTMTAGLIAAFLANTAAQLNLSDSAAAIAAVMHPLQLGGIAIQSTIPVPTPQPIL
jgi:hypothetical protein